MKRLLILLALLPVLVSAQTVSHGKIFTPSTTTAGAKLTCAALPSSPANGDIACDSGDSNKVKAYSNGSWVEVGAGSAATRNELRTTRAALVLTFNNGCTSSAPCNIRGYQFTASGTLTITGGTDTGTVWLEVDESGNVDARHNVTDGNLSCSGCTKVASATGYSDSGWQGYTWPITSGNFDAAVGTFDKRNFAYQKRIINGTGTTVTETFDDATVGINTAVVPQFSDIQASSANYCASSDGSDTYTCALTPTLTSYTTGACFLLNVTTNNTGAATCNIDTLGAKALKIISAGAKADPADNRIDADDLIKICYDGTDFILQTSEGGGASTTTWEKDSSSCASGNGGVQHIGAGFHWSAGGATIASVGDNENVCYLQLDDGADEYIYFETKLPSNWDSSSTIDVLIVWQNGGADNNMVWDLDVACWGDGDSFTPSLTDETDQTTGVGASPDLRHTTTFSSITKTGCLAGDNLKMQITRVGTDGGDTNTSSARIRSVTVKTTITL
jgi:hypothetical protein